MQSGSPFSGSVAGLFSSLGVLTVLFLFLSGYIVPTAVNHGLVEGNFIDSGRYAITNPAMATIAEEDTTAIVSIGSSILQYATDGACIGESLDAEGTNVYNLAIGGANPYTEMIQIPALINANPETVIIDLGPNSLWNFYESESLDEYIEFRFTILSLTLPLHDEQGWQSLVRKADAPYLAMTLEERIRLTASYSQVATDNFLFAELHEYIGAVYRERNMPDVGGEGWLEYLQTPTFLPPKFEVKNQTEVVEWFDENMAKRARAGVYNPEHNGTLNHAALDYIIGSMTEAGIEVLMVAVPHHPMVYSYLQPGQIDGHNSTLSYFEEKYGATSVNWFWETWDEGMFRDSNHLGDEGRIYYCERMAEYLNQR